jgi:hypothetical protein
MKWAGETRTMRCNAAFLGQFQIGDQRARHGKLGTGESPQAVQ